MISFPSIWNANLLQGLPQSCCNIFYLFFINWLDTIQNHSINVVLKNHQDAMASEKDTLPHSEQFVY
ncbi:MAG TPA: hypothetical protein DEP78_07545 [Verrucomicrobiales bacterium]|nr:hypothetical protein [Verrucomicrobiales bacterium]